MYEYALHHIQAQLGSALNVQHLLFRCSFIVNDNHDHGHDDLHLYWYYQNLHVVRLCVGRMNIS